MAHGGHKTPPPHTCTHVVTRSSLDNHVTLETTASNDNLDIPVEPVTLVPQGVEV